MVSAIKLSYHKRLFLMLLAFSWSIILCFVGFQYTREKQYKSEFLNAQLQLYNKNLIERIENGYSYEDYIKYNGEEGCKNAGKLRIEGKDYVMQDGDIFHFRFNV